MPITNSKKPFTNSRRLTIHKPDNFTPEIKIINGLCKLSKPYIKALNKNIY